MNRLPAKLAAALLVGMVLCSPLTAAAETSDPQKDRPKLNLNLDLGLLSTYVFRGGNFYQTTSRWDQNLLLSTGVTWGIFDTGFAIAYWGGYQLAGDNNQLNLDAGISGEQDLSVSYSRTFLEALTLTGTFAVYLYPFAKEDVAGMTVPAIIEPIVSASYTKVLDFGLSVSYFHGVQALLDDAGFRYVYINPSVGKTFALHSRVDLRASAGFGYKIYNNGDIKDNAADVIVTVVAPIKITEILYAKPVVNLGWSNYEALPAKDELIVWGGINLGVNL